MSLNETVLAVDLDGTLIKGDVTEESFLWLLRRNPLKALISLILLVFQGNAKFKEYLSKHVSINPHNQLFTEDFLEFLKNQKAAGRKLVLISASHQQLVEKFKDDIFDEAHGTTDVNLRGINKVKLLKRKYGSFDYAGNTWVDFKVFEHAREAILVNPTPKIQKAFKKKFPNGLVFGARPSLLRSVVKSLRIPHWIKNTLIFAPGVLSHALDGATVINLTLGFILFNLICSGIYILNDLFDLKADRKHSRKRLRPIASGDLSIFLALIILSILLGSSLITSLFFFPPLCIISLGYLLLNYFYSSVIKRMVILDIFTLSSFYLLRLAIGASIAEVELSGWLLVFSLFGFLSLSSMKRFSEIFNENKTFGRNYSIQDSYFLKTFGICCGLLCSLVYLLYLNSPTVDTLYTSTFFLWLVFPILLYWYSKTWLLVCRGVNLEDPVLSVISSKENLGLFLLCLSFFLLAL